MTAKIREAIGYLDNLIKTTSTKPAKLANLNKPTTKPKITIVMITSESTSWECNEPTVSKWKVQNTWIKRLLMYNIHNIIGLGADILEIAERLWNSLMDLYDRISEIAKLYVEEQLRSLHLCDGNDFPNHVIFIRQLW